MSKLESIRALPRPQLFKKPGREVAVFRPQEAKAKIAKADGVIEYARSIRDWPLLEDAINAKIDQQQEVVDAWHEKVTPNHGGDRRSRSRSPVADLDRWLGAFAEAGFTKQHISYWGKRLKDRESYFDSLFAPTYRKAMGEKGQSDLRGASGTGNDEWHTPPEYLDLVRNVLGDIDLDPASSKLAQKTVDATRFYTLADGGLTHPWGGRVWLNPPYAQPFIAQFAAKMVAEVQAGHVTAAIMLTHNYTDTTWFHALAGVAAAICFPRGRVKFVDAKGKVAAPTQGQAFFYFGENVASFAEYFGDIGLIATPWCAGGPPSSGPRTQPPPNGADSGRAEDAKETGGSTRTSKEILSRKLSAGGQP